jgi:hypothetical protein
MINFIGHVNLDRLAHLGKMATFLKNFFSQVYHCVLFIFYRAFIVYGQITKQQRSFQPRSLTTTTHVILRLLSTDVY